MNGAARIIVVALALSETDLAAAVESFRTAAKTGQHRRADSSTAIILEQWHFDD